MESFGFLYRVVGLSKSLRGSIDLLRLYREKFGKMDDF